MDKLEKLIATIMKECEADGEPVTYEEAKEMAEMEVKANKDCKTYAQSTEKRKPAQKERKVDEEKGHLLGKVKTLLEELKAEILAMKTETEIEFLYGGNHYTMKLTKHRPPKKQAVTRGNSSVGRALDF